MPEMNYREAMNRALREALDENENAYIMGEDIGPYGGTYAVTRGLYDEYGPSRIKDAPLSESVIVGAGIGSAIVGMKPIIEIMTINFSLLAMDQIVNHAAKLRYMSAGQIEIPLIIRMVTGGGAQLGATHSQNFEGWFASVPGLTVVAPATPYDALGLFRASRDTRDPVIFVEHALLYSLRGDVPEEHYMVPIGRADVKKSGKDVTIVSHSRMVHVAMGAAQELERIGISVEIVDLRSLRPLDMDTVIKSVEKTHNAIVLEETWKTGGFGGEIASQIVELGFNSLDSPVMRIGGEDVPAPYTHVLEGLAFPDIGRIVKGVRSLLDR